MRTQRNRAITAVALTVLIAVASLEVAALITDGNSQPVRLTVTSAALDRAHHRVLVSAPRGSLAPGRRVASAEISSHRFAGVLRDVSVERVAGSPSALALRYAGVDTAYRSFGARCQPDVDVCLVEQ